MGISGPVTLLLGIMHILFQMQFVHITNKALQLQSSLILSFSEVGFCTRQVHHTGGNCCSRVCLCLL